MEIETTTTATDCRPVRPATIARVSHTVPASQPSPRAYHRQILVPEPHVPQEAMAQLQAIAVVVRQTTVQPIKARLNPVGVAVRPVRHARLAETMAEAVAAEVTAAAADNFGNLYNKGNQHNMAG